MAGYVPTQCKQILDYMRENGSIAQRDAIELGCYRLSARIFDLRRAGHPIKRSLEQVVKKNGIRTMICRYSLWEEKL